MYYASLTLEEVTKALMGGNIKGIWYADMEAILGDRDKEFVALRPLSQASVKDILERTTVFFKIDEIAEVDITKRI